ncbi:hypothetical protein SCAR479_13841 [Seiridium cardinale]|uniref:Uncharacterized protein n=1 Tax=Seiridium cardinale TaxID=138064 RepID=A0ABR2X6U3_9PEZI
MLFHARFLRLFAPLWILTPLLQQTILALLQRAYQVWKGVHKSSASIFSVNLDSQQQSIELPYPAVKCVIGQCLEIFANNSWAWLVVGSFYDDKDHELWHIEVIIGRKPSPTESQSDQQRFTHNTPNSTASSSPWLDYRPPQQLATAFPTFADNTPLPPLHLSPYSYAMSTAIGRGWNPTSGYDAGGLPPGTSFAGMGFPAMPDSGYGYGVCMPFAAVAPTWVPGPPGSVGPVYTMNANGYQIPVPVVPGQPGGPRYPTAHPVVSSECPALNLQNSTGGMGCEPGYNYYFPAEHTKIHVLKSRDPPWRLAHATDLTFAAYHVPVQITLGDLMKGFGATNPTAKKNKITEITQGGSGQWYKGVTFSADDEDSMMMCLKDLGWDSSRTGRQGEKSVVWLWVTKD